MFYTLIKHGFLTNQSARRVLSIFQRQMNDGDDDDEPKKSLITNAIPL